MFTWSHEDSIEVNLPIQKAWTFYTNPTNWLKWEDQFDVVVFEGILKAGSQIKAKIKNRPLHIAILVTEVKPYEEFKSVVKHLLITQESGCSFQEISPERTRITLRFSVISFFLPFIKNTSFKKVEKTYSKCLNAFAEIAEPVCQ